jgi:hypothetical protein
MAVSSAGLRPKSHCSGKAQKQLQTRPLVKEGAPHQETRNRQGDKRKSGHGTQMGARHQDKLAD